MKMQVCEQMATSHRARGPASNRFRASDLVAPCRNATIANVAQIANEYRLTPIE